MYRKPDTIGGKLFPGYVKFIVLAGVVLAVAAYFFI